MDLRIDRVRAALVQMILDSDDIELLEKLLREFDHENSVTIEPMTRALYLKRTQEGLESAKMERRYSSDEVRAHFGIR